MDLIFFLKPPISPIPSLLVAVEKHRIVTSFKVDSHGAASLLSFTHLFLWLVLSPLCLFCSIILISLCWTDQKDSGYPSMFFLLIPVQLSSFPLSFSRSLTLTLSLTPFFTCRNLLSSMLTFSLIFFGALSSLLHSPTSLTLSCFYPNHEKILEQRKKGWSTEPLSVRWFFFFF